MAIPLQVRELIVSRIEAGVPRKVITGATGVSPSTLSRLLRRHRETGQLTPGYGGGQPVKVDARACGEIMVFHAGSSGCLSLGIPAPS